MNELILKFKNLFNGEFPFCNSYLPSVLSSLAMKNDIDIKYGVGIRASNTVSSKNNDIEIFTIARALNQPQIFSEFQKYVFFGTRMSSISLNFGVSFLNQEAKDLYDVSLSVSTNREKMTLTLKEVSEQVPDPENEGEVINQVSYIWSYGDFEADSISDESLDWSQAQLDMSKVFEQLIMREKITGSFSVSISARNRDNGEIVSNDSFVFVSDEEYSGEDSDFCISDNEIECAIDQARAQFRGQCLSFEMQEKAMLYLAAHVLALGLRNQTGSQFSESSRSVGSVSVSYDIPESIKSNPYLSNLFQTGFGSQYYLMIQSCVNSLPFVMCGRTTP